ncbi:MAG: hypothetical protein MRJ66_16340 [Nitrospira sp.]|nr:hypothetical protein [Nitrospira sp.]
MTVPAQVQLNDSSRSRGWGNRWSPAVLCSVLVIVLSVASKLQAAEWSVSPSLGVKGVYNSNLLLTPLPHDDTYGYWVTPAMEVAGNSERLEVSSRLAADVVGYFGGEDRQFTNVFVPLSIRYKTEKDVIGFSGGLTRDNTLLSELQATGVVLQFAQRNQWSFNPTWTRMLTEKLSFQSGVQFSDTTYESGRLVDYRLFGGSGGFSYALTERDQVQIMGSYLDFRTTNSPTGIQAGYTGVDMSLTHMFSESLSGAIHGGPRFLRSSSEFMGDSFTTHDTVWLVGASLRKTFERAALRVSFERDLVPSGFGLLLQTNRAEAVGSYDLSETLACSLNVVGVLTSGKSQVVVGGVFPDSRYVSITPKLSWKFLEWWQAEVSYMYRWRDIDTQLDSANSHATTFMVTYYPPKRTFFH